MRNLTRILTSGEYARREPGARTDRRLRDWLEKTGRRLTSDPIRTSLGLLPSGPDPVGEWLVHPQSPPPHFGPKGRANKPGRAPEPPSSSWPSLSPASPPL